MDHESFRGNGKKLVDYIVQYHDSIDRVHVARPVKVGYLEDQLPSKYNSNLFIYLKAIECVCG